MAVSVTPGDVGMGGKTAIKSLLWKMAPIVYSWRPSLPRQLFSIGIYQGKTPFSLQPMQGVSGPVIDKAAVTDIPAIFVADPFLYRNGSRYFMFFEVLNRINRRGEIGVAESEDLVNWNYGQIVLSEPFHLSYPYLFEWNGVRYMVPESADSGSIRLYREKRFPDEWTYEGDLLTGAEFLDTSVFQFEGHWYLLTSNQERGFPPCLRLYHSEELLGPWVEHRCSPVVRADYRTARSAGRTIFYNGSPIRFSQQVHPVYGERVFAFEITDLSPDSYEERQIGSDPVLDCGSDQWNGGGMHHVDAQFLEEEGIWIAAVDGFCDGSRKAQI